MGQQQTTGYVHNSAANRYGRKSTRVARINEGLHIYSTGRYSQAQTLQILNNIVHHIQNCVTNSGLKLSPNVHTSTTNKTMTYRITKGTKTFTIDFKIGFATSANNLKNMKTDQPSFKIEGCTVVSCQKSGLHVVNGSAAHHLFHASVEDLSLDNCPGLEDFQPFILNYFNLDKKK